MPEINDEENLSSVDTVEQADALLDAVEQPDHGPIQDAPPQPQMADEFDLTIGGKQIKAKRDQLIQWAQQGYSAPSQLSRLTKELDGWKKKWTEHEPRFNEMHQKYGPVDDYVRQNPQFWDHVLKSYEQRNQVLNDQSNPLAGMVTDLQKQIQDLTQFKGQFEQEQEKKQVAQEDQAYLQTFETVKQAHPDIDFDTPDEEGKSLEYKVLEYAQQEGIKNFKTAFRDFYHDELLKRTETKAKESFTKEKQKNTKLGILGITPTPAKQAQSDHRGKSYDQLAEEALRELGLR